MKKNYLLAALVGALALSGCGGNSTSSSSTQNSSSIVPGTSSSSAPATPTVEGAVENLALDYTVNYTIAATGEERSILVEDTDDTSEVYFYSEYSNDGYYVDNSGDVYYYYMNGFNKPTYNTVGKLKDKEATIFKSSIDVKAAFEDASWDLVSSGKTFVYFTEDEEAINTCVFLSNGVGKDSVESVEVSLSSKGKLSGFTTYDASGDVVVSGEFKRLGTTYALDYAPELNDNLDLALVNRWVIVPMDETPVDTLLGSDFDMFEVFEDGSLVKYDETEDGYAVPSDVYSYAMPLGNGTYAFTNEAEDIVILQFYYGVLYFATADSETQEQSSAAAMSYYTLMFLTEAEKAGYVVEPMTQDDQMYEDCVASIDAIGAYYIAELDENGEAVDLIIVTEFVNILHILDEYMGGDATLYNGCSFGGYIYANFAVTAGMNQDSVLIMYEITNRLYPEFVEVDESRYNEVTEGISALDYLIEVMTSLGYEYNNAAKPGKYAEDIKMIMDVNNGVEPTDPENPIPEEGTEEEATPASLIILENGTDSYP